MLPAFLSSPRAGSTKSFGPMESGRSIAAGNGRIGGWERYVGVLDVCAEAEVIAESRIARVAVLTGMLGAVVFMDGLTAGRSSLFCTKVGSKSPEFD
jgi:hypothetical protein